MEKEYISIISCDINSVVEEVKSKFIVGQRYSKAYIKETLRIIYKTSGYSKTPKAIDLEELFDLKSCNITNKETGKRDPGFEIIKLKDPENSTV